MIPRVAAVHDLAGLGRCSLTIALPVLSAMGVCCCPVPTAVLSTQTGGYRGYSFTDMTDDLPAYIGHWKTLGLSFDGVYTGFLGSERQIAIVSDFISFFRRPGSLTLVDPVMGDDGRTYDTYTQAMCRSMGSLVRQADAVTPNLTEAAILLGEDCKNVPSDEEGLRGWASGLSALGPRMVAITGIELPGPALGVACLDSAKDEFRLIRTRRAGGNYPGAGDLFASVLTGGLLHGLPLSEAAERAADFVYRCAANTVACGSPVREGLVFEPLLGILAAER